MSEKNSNVKLYYVGFVLSIILTIEAFWLVKTDALSYWLSLFALVGLAVVQMFVQLIFFLGLASEKKPRLNSVALVFALTTAIIVVAGSIWIIENLEKNHEKFFTSEEYIEYIKEDEAIDNNNQ